MCLVSIVVPTFNRSGVLMRALESVYMQTFKGFEVIVIDDGSTDNTAEMIKEKYPDVHYLYQSNLGVSSARNKGMSIAKGEWIAFLDSDDEWLSHKLEKQLALLEENSEYKICHTEEVWIRKGVRVNQMKKHKKTGGWIFPQCLPLCAMSPSSIIIHQSIFDEIGFFDTQFPACEDYDLWLRITAKFPVLYIEEPQIKKYGGHDDQLSQKYWGMDQYRIKALEKIISQNVLTEENKLQAITVLLKKCKIFHQGAVKRGKTIEANHYQQIMDSFQEA